MVVAPWTGMPPLEPPFAFQIGKNWPSYGLSMVHMKSDVMNITCYMTSNIPCLRPAFCHKNKQNDYSDILL